MMYESRFTETKSSSSQLKHAIVGGIFGIIIGLVVLLVLSLLIAFTDLPESFGRIFVLIATAAGAISAGIYAANRIKRRGLMTGILSGGIFFVLIFVVGLIIGEDGMDGVNILLKVVLSLLAGGIGGIIGVGNHRVR